MIFEHVKFLLKNKFKKKKYQHFANKKCHNYNIKINKNLMEEKNKIAFLHCL